MNRLLYEEQFEELQELAFEVARAYVLKHERAVPIDDADDVALASWAENRSKLSFVERLNADKELEEEAYDFFYEWMPNNSAELADIDGLPGPAD
jgi:hypothetical protein